MILDATEHMLDRSGTIRCQGDSAGSGCPRWADRRIEWRTEHMAAPAFYYVCEYHAMYDWWMKWWAAQ